MPKKVHKRVPQKSTPKIVHKKVHKIVPKKVRRLLKVPKIVPKIVLFLKKVPKIALLRALFVVQTLYGQKRPIHLDGRQVSQSILKQDSHLLGSLCYHRRGGWSQCWSRSCCCWKGDHWSQRCPVPDHTECVDGVLFKHGNWWQH